MSAAMDVAYLDLPYGAHVERRSLLLRMTPSCWEDWCHDCQGCSCACHDEPPLRALPVAGTRRCRTCGYPVRSENCKAACGTVTARINRLADSIGGLR